MNEPRKIGHRNKECVCRDIRKREQNESVMATGEEKDGFHATKQVETDTSDKNRARKGGREWCSGLFYMSADSSQSFDEKEVSIGI